MLQIATFSLPDEQDNVNEFLKTHKPIGNIEFNKDMIFIGYETGENPVEYQIATLRERLSAQRETRFQHEIALHVLDYEQADLNPKHNKQKWDDIENAKLNIRRTMSIEEAKGAFVEKRIAELQSGHGGNQTQAEAGQPAKTDAATS